MRRLARRGARPSSQPGVGGGSAYQSRSSGAAITASIAAASATRCASGPPATRVANRPSIGWCGTRPVVGLMPYRPQKLAGMRMEPPPSLPNASVPTPAASAAAAPPLDPPEEWVGTCGLRVAAPRRRLSVMPFQPNSGNVVLPSSTAPASRKRATTGASAAAGVPRVVSEPWRVGKPAWSVLSLMVTGTPSSGPSGRPSRHRSADARAMARAPSRSTSWNAFRSGSRTSMRARACSATVTGALDSAEKIRARSARDGVARASDRMLRRNPAGGRPRGSPPRAARTAAARRRPTTRGRRSGCWWEGRRHPSRRGSRRPGGR